MLFACSVLSTYECNELKYVGVYIYMYICIHYIFIHIYTYMYSVPFLSYKLRSDNDRQGDTSYHNVRLNM
jgi:hypothetical protein